MHRDQSGEFVCGYWCLKGWNKPLKPTQQELIFIWVPSIAKNYSQPNSPHPSLDGILVHHSIAPNGMLKKTQNQRPVRGEVKWEIVSWLRSKWLWATKLGKNYVVSKIYIRFLISLIMIPFYQIFRIESSERNTIQICFFTFYFCLCLQGCALRKIEGSPVLWNCKI